jgi:Ca-activated chloride channel family protein
MRFPGPFVRKLANYAVLWMTATPIALAQAPEPVQTEPPPIRVTVNRVNVPVTVTDSDGRLVEGLRREDFHIFDNGVEQPITDFAPVEQSTQVVLLVESGPAVLFLAKDHVLAADAFLRSIPPADRVAIASYTRAPELILNFTQDKMAAREALQELSFVNGFGDLNLSSSLATTIDWIASVPGKKTIVLLSTGVDSSPPETWKAVQKKLQTSDVRIFAVSLSADIRQPAKMKKLTPQDRSNRAEVKEGFEQADRSLHELSEATGGRVYFPKDPADFERAYNEIANLVANEYSLAFAPTSLDGQVHTLDVKVRISTYRVDHRQAYLALAPN